jgi:hypothetical protein
VGVVEPSIVTDPAAPHTHQRPSRRNASDRCGDAANAAAAPASSAISGTEPADPPVAATETDGHCPSKSRRARSAPAMATRVVTAMSTRTSPRRRPTAVMVTTTTHTRSDPAPRRHRRSSTDGTSSIRSTRADSNPDSGTATAPSTSETVRDTTSQSTSEPDRSRCPPRAAAKNGTPRAAGRHSVPCDPLTASR